MLPKVLSAAQVEQFIELGCTKVEEAFPASQALAAQEFIWDRLEARGIRRGDRTTWTEPFVRINEMYDDPVFLACMTRRLSDAVEDVVGEGRWREYMRPRSWGWWPVNFHMDADKPWDVPCDDWHWDGTFRHTIDAWQQGLLLLCIFSEIGPRGGATLVAEGSHKVVARFLNRYPEGVEANGAIKQANAEHPWLAELTATDSAFQPGSTRVERFMNAVTTDAAGTRLRVAETIGNPGDIYLCHPFLCHSTSPNHSGRPRFVCNHATPLFEKMSLVRPDGNYSPVEISIRDAIG